VYTHHSDHDLEVLEAHLDGSLPADASVALCRRLEAEPRLAAALKEVRSERAARYAVWASFEPDDARAEATVSTALASATRQDRLRRAARNARRVTAAAAVVAIAFAGGWAARARVSSEQSSPTATRAPLRNAHNFITSGGGEASGSYPVALTDENGNITAVQYFSDPQAARDFAEDVDRWQSPPRPQSAGAERIVPASGEF
jgi:anti-sigma factor RsiW